MQTLRLSGTIPFLPPICLHGVGRNNLMFVFCCYCKCALTVTYLRNNVFRIGTFIQLMTSCLRHLIHNSSLLTIFGFPIPLCSHNNVSNYHTGNITYFSKYLLPHCYMFRRKRPSSGLILILMNYDTIEPGSGVQTLLRNILPPSSG
jgi:hypothetical protein